MPSYTIITEVIHLVPQGYARSRLSEENTEMNIEEGSTNISTGYSRKAATQESLDKLLGT